MVRQHPQGDPEGLSTLSRHASARGLDRAHSATGSAPAGFLRYALQLVAVSLPPPLVSWRHVVVAVTQPGCSVDELADDVGVTGVPIGLGDHVHEDAVQ